MAALGEKCKFLYVLINISIRLGARKIISLSMK